MATQRTSLPEAETTVPVTPIRTISGPGRLRRGVLRGIQLGGVYQRCVLRQSP
jgi:hypothetical protein